MDNPYLKYFAGGAAFPPSSNLPPAQPLSELDMLHSALAAAQARIARLEEAVKSFTDKEPGGNYRDDVMHTLWINAGQFRRARAALETKP